MEEKDGAGHWDELTNSVEAALARKGVLKVLKAKLRAEIYHILENKQEIMPEKPREVYFATELVRELLMDLKLENTLSVFMEEVGQPIEGRVDREFLSHELGISTSNKKIPLLVLLVEKLLNEKDIREANTIPSTDVTFENSNIY